jgi:3-phenylpropionate/cinnamic acid dioxygenase small subunit
MSPTILEDKDAINDLFSEYAVRADACDWHAVAALFTEDGEFSGRIGQATGPQKIGDLLVAMNPTATSGPKRRHFTANSLIKVNGDTATARTTYMVFIDRGDGPHPIVFGAYLDDLVRVTPGQPEWMFRRRVLVHDIVAEDIGLNRKI